MKKGSVPGVVNRRRCTCLYAGGVCLLALLLTLNLLAVALPWRLTKLDVGGGNISRVSDKTLRLVGDLREDVRVYWLCENGETDYSVELFLTRYAEAGDRIQLQIIDTVAQPTFVSKYVGTGSSLSNYSLIVESDRRVTLLDYTDLYLFSNDVINSLYGKETFLTAAQLTQFMTYYSSVLKNSVTSRYFRGEAQLSGAIDYVTAAEVPHGYLLTGHGDAALPELMLNALSSYGLSTLDLSAAGQVPTDADCLILYAPERDLTGTEEQLLRAFLRRGGSLLLVTDPARLSACPRVAGLGELYGLSALPGIVSDADTAHHVGSSATYLKPDCNKEHTVTATIGENCTVTMPSSHAIALPDKVPVGVTVTPVLSTSAQAVRLDSDGKTALSEPGTLHVGVAADLAVTSSDGGSRVGHFVWLGSSSAFTAAAAEASEYGNYSCLLAFFLYMSETFTSEFSSVTPVCMDGSSLSLSRPSSALWGVAVAVLLPAACLTAGFCIRARRRRA